MIRVTVDFLGLPHAAKLAGAKAVPLALPGGTIADAIAALTSGRDPRLGKLLLDGEGKLDLAFQVILNGKEWLRREQLDRPLGDGDRLTITMLVGGG
jgi:hypothetical protein